jgi:hypothetical protein
VIDQAEPEPLDQAEPADQPAPEPVERTAATSVPPAAEDEPDQAAPEPAELTPAASTPPTFAPIPPTPAPLDADAAIVTLDSDDDFDDFNVRPRRSPATPRELPQPATSSQPADESARPERRSWRETKPPARANGGPHTVPPRSQKPAPTRDATPSAGRANGAEPQPPEREPSGYSQRRLDMERPASPPATPRGRSIEPETPAPRRTPGPARGPNIPPREPPREPPRSTPRPTRPTEPEPAADVGAMIDRMRRLRQQREAEQQAATPRKESFPARGAAEAPAESVELRFHIGERVQCLPYGVGIVRASRIADGRELVQIEFPDYGEIEVDPAISLVRQLSPRADSPRADEQTDLNEE